MVHTFRVTVSGTYTYKDPASGKKLFKQYPVQYPILAEEHLEVAISVIRTHYLPKILRQLDPHFIRVRQTFIEETLPLNGGDFSFLPDDRRVRLMSREQMTRFIQIKKLPVIPDLYGTTQALRDITILALESPEAVKAKQEKLGKVSTSFGLLQDLNPELAFNSSPALAKVNAEEEKRQLVEQAKAMGINATMTWKVETLKEKINAAIVSPTSLSTNEAIAEDLPDHNGITVIEGPEMLMGKL